MKTIKPISYLLFSLMLMSSCVTGKYTTRVESATGSGLSNEAPLKLKMFGKARFTIYHVENSSSSMYFEETKYKMKGDTLLFKRRAIYGDTNILSKEYVPTYLVDGDTLKSLSWETVYVRKPLFD